ncbi:MAG TPA: DUF488 domain-containing protein [Terriglobales bacterium]|nr:DUF488 domain-containing protein [Terriglobales bacterium]
MSTLYTIGHSTRDLAEFSRVLQVQEIRVLADIRAFPMSRRHPQYNREALELWLPEIGIEYRWVQALGGRRKKILAESPNVALRNDSFRNYADYMLTAPFQEAVAELVQLADSTRVAIMCAERVYFQCHRMMVSDYLVAHGHQALHIDNEKPPREHQLMKEARMVDGELIYKGDRLF